MSRAAFSENVACRVEDLRAQHGDSVRLEDVADVVASLMTTVEGDINRSDLKLHEELKDLVEFIHRARQEIAAIEPERMKREEFQTASDELDAVIIATEEAAGHFLDAAEIVEQIASEVTGAASESLLAAATKIYEASSFQDITGQRITKVVSTLQQIETRIERLAHLSEGHVVQDEVAAADAAAEDGIVEVDEEADLLNGPSMPDIANSQDDIDALLASFD